MPIRVRETSYLTASLWYLIYLMMYDTWVRRRHGYNRSSHLSAWMHCFYDVLYWLVTFSILDQSFQESYKQSWYCQNKVAFPARFRVIQLLGTRGSLLSVITFDEVYVWGQGEVTQHLLTNCLFCKVKRQMFIAHNSKIRLSRFQLNWKYPN